MSTSHLVELVDSVIYKLKGCNIVLNNYTRSHKQCNVIIEIVKK